MIGVFLRLVMFCIVVFCVAVCLEMVRHPMLLLDFPCAVELLIAGRRGQGYVASL